MTLPLIAVDALSDRIHLVRGQRVMLDSDLAELYGVATKRFNEQVKRNIERFPADFMFQLTEEEGESLRSQIATLKPGRGLDDLERKLSTHDQAIAGLIDAIRQLTATPAKPSRPIGFTADLKAKK